MAKKGHFEASDQKKSLQWPPLKFDSTFLQVKKKIEIFQKLALLAYFGKFSLRHVYKMAQMGHLEASDQKMS